MTPRADRTFGAPACTRRLARFLLWALLCLALPVAAEIPVPALTAHVNDTAGLLDAARRTALEQRLADFERTRGTQLVLLTLPTTDGEPIESFGLRVAEAWRIGRAKVDDGALLIVARDDRRVRIEVGYGLEGVLTDATSRRIIEEAIVPAFRAGDYAGGIEAALQRMMQVAAGEALPAPAPARPSAGDPYTLALFFAFFFAVALQGLRHGAVRAAGAGLAAGGATLLLTQLAAATGLSALAAIVLATLLGGRGGRGSRWASHRRYGGRDPGGWYGGGWGGGLGGGLGGGRFGGGGGGFGGGGASGSW